MSESAIVLTGATGVVGMEVLARLVEREEEVIVLLRAQDRADAQGRLEATLARLWDEPRAHRVTAFAADVTEPALGLTRTDRREIRSRADRIVHCAAAVGFDQTLPDALSINALGSQRVLELANDLDDLDRVVHVSTAFVAGRHDGVFRETDLALGQSFRNTYEQSKHLGERLVVGSGLPVAIARPSIVVGDSTTGWTPAFSALYLPLRAYALGLLDTVAAVADGVVDVVPLDYVAASLLQLLDAPEAPGNTYHLVAGERAATVADVLRLAQERFAQPRAAITAAPRGAGTDALVPYFDVRTRFDDTASRALLEPHGISSEPLDALFARLMDYAEATRWGRAGTTREAAAHARAEHVLVEAA